MNINIRITEGCGIVVNRNELSQKQAQAKNQLYGQPPAQKDRAPPSSQKPPRQNSASVTKKQLNSKPNPTAEQQKRFERQMNENIKEMSKNQASLGMLHTNNQIIRNQQDILKQQQKVIKELSRKDTEESQKQPKTTDQQKQQQALKDMTSDINKQLEEIRKLRDDIFRVAKDFTTSLNESKSPGKVPQIPSNLVEMNKNLQNLAQQSHKNIDLISPEKLQMLSKLQNFNLQGYTQHLNQLKNQLAAAQKQSDQVEKQLRLRVAKLEQIKIPPKFDDLLAQPYENNIKNRLSTINLQDAKKRITDRLGGDFDYVKFDIEISQIESELKNQLSEFYTTTDKFRIHVPDIRLDQKQLRSLDVRLPSILEEYKAQRGIVIQPPAKKDTVVRQPQFQRTGSQGRPTDTMKSQGSAKKLRQASGDFNKKTTNTRQKSTEIITKPKDYASSVKYKNVNQDAFKTVLGQTNAEKRRQEEIKNKEPAVVQPAQPQKKKKTRQEQDFQKYLENRANEELQELYRERKERLAKMKNELYQEMADEPPVRISMENRRRILIDEPLESENKEKPKEVSREKNGALGIPGKKLVDPQEGMTIKEIGKEVLLDKIKSIFASDKPQPNQEPVRVVQPPVPGTGVSMAAGSGIENFAEGFLSVMNNTFSAMNRGLSAGIQRKIKEREERAPYDPASQKIHIPLPILEEIPKPPVFNLKFDRNIRVPYGQQAPSQNTGFFPMPQGQGIATFTNLKQGGQVQKNNFQHVDVSDLSYSQIDLDKSDIKSDISGISNAEDIRVSRSGNLTRSRQ